MRRLKKRGYTKYQKMAHGRHKYNPSKNKYTVRRSFKRYKKHIL